MPAKQLVLTELRREYLGTDPHFCAVCNETTVHKMYVLEGTEIAVFECTTKNCGNEDMIVPK